MSKRADRVIEEAKKSKRTGFQAYESYKRMLLENLDLKDSYEQYVRELAKVLKI